jgi:hypothetical protein
MTRVSMGSLILVVGAAAAVAAQQHALGAKSDEALITSAMTAAPAAVAKDATIIDVSADGKIRTVRKGTNSFSCMADNPETPGPDAMCGDQNAMEWVNALINKREPPPEQGRIHVHARGRHRCKQHRPVRAEANREQQLDQDRIPRDGRRSKRDDGRIPAGSETGYVEALRDVGRDAVRALDAAGKIAGPQTSGKLQAVKSAHQPPS